MLLKTNYRTTTTEAKCIQNALFASTVCINQGNIFLVTINHHAYAFLIHWKLVSLINGAEANQDSKEEMTVRD